MSRSVQPATAARLRAPFTVNPVIRGTRQLACVVAPLADVANAGGTSERQTTDTTVNHDLSDHFMAPPYRSVAYSDVAPCAWFEISSTN